MLHNLEQVREMVVGAYPQRLHFPGGRESRFRAIVDAHGYQCGAVTEDYRLITNPTIAHAVDLASDSLGLDLYVKRAAYSRGKFKLSMTMPDTFRVPGDNSGIQPQLEIGNGYGGGAALTGKAGVYRQVCTNGLIIGTVVSQAYQRHVGNIDIYGMVLGLMEAVIARANAAKVTAELAAQTAFENNPDNAAFLAGLLEDTAKKYQQPLVNAIDSNRREVGPTVWAILQAISEVATHDMRGWNADAWQARQTNSVLEYAGIGV